MIDELPFFIENLIEKDNNIPLITQILATLRAWRNAGIPMIIAGSISLDQQLEDLEISGLVFNDVTRLPLKPLERDEAVKLLKELAKTRDLRSWSDETINLILEEIDDHFPYFIQVAFGHLAVEDNADPEYVDRIFREQINPQLHLSFLSQFDERLQNRFSTDERGAAEKILNEMARAEECVLERSEVDRMLEGSSLDSGAILRKLTAQGFLEQVHSSPKFGFAFCMLRRWRISRGA